MSFVVFAVDNADRLTLMGPPVAGQPTLKQVALSYITAPKQAKRVAMGEFGSEEPCAYDATELIRSHFIGKTVRFTEDYYIDALKRSAGRLTLANGDDDAATLLLAAGLATVPERSPPRMDKTLYASFAKLMNEAKAARRGLFAPDAKQHVRHLRQLSPEELGKKATALRGKECLARVERVLGATALIISCKELGETQVPVHLTGISGRDVESEEIAAMGKFHTERYLLHRNVKVRFDGGDAAGNLRVSVISPKGSFQEELLAQGLATVQNATLSLTSRIAELQAAEAVAKRGRRGVWKDYTDPQSLPSDSQPDKGDGATTADGTTPATTGAAPTTAAARLVAGGGGGGGAVVVAASGEAAATGLPVLKPDGTEAGRYTGPTYFTGLLVQAVHGDTVTVRDDATGQQVRLSLSGVRSSKSIVRDQDGNAPEARVTYNDYAWEAREFMRTRFVGQKVAVQVECARMMPETREIRPVATVMVVGAETNIGAALLQSGFASFFVGRNDVCPTAALLRAAEEKARVGHKGIHSGEPARPVTVVELSHLGESRGRYYLSFLQRGMQGSRPPVLRGVVDLVLGPSSLRVYIPKENFQIPVKVAGVITPNAGFGGATEKSDPFAEEAKDFAVRLLQQRDVNLQVYASDRAGNFITSVCLMDGTNASVALVSAGFATVGNADRLPFQQQLIDAQEDAQAAKKYIWSDPHSQPSRFVKSEMERATQNATVLTLVSGAATETFQPYTLTEVGEDGISVYLQPRDATVEEQRHKMQELLKSLAGEAEYLPRRNELVVAQYSADKSWCRARVRLVHKEENAAEVQFVDYGNIEAVRVRRIRAIPRGPEYAPLRDTPPLVKFARLSFVHPRPSSDAFVSAACDTVYEYTEGDVLAKPVYKDPTGTFYYSVTVNEGMPSLSETLLQRGYALLDRRCAGLHLPEYKMHEAAKEVARRGHKGLWEYGDVDDDEEEQ